MLGYDWPRLHAALNDLPTALLVTAVLFDLLAAAHPARQSSGRWASGPCMVGAVGGAPR